jgi:hypothetical protein
MKRIAYLILIAIPFILLSGCGDDSPTQENLNDNSKLNISGSVFGWQKGSGAALSFSDLKGKTQVSSISSANINSHGFFSITLTLPLPYLMKPITEFHDSTCSASHLTFSDSTAKFYTGELVITKNQIYEGRLLWTDVYNMGVEAPYYRAKYYYFDKDVIITGKIIRYPVEWDYGWNYNLSMKKGWNVVLSEFTPTGALNYINYKPINADYIMMP